MIPAPVTHWRLQCERTQYIIASFPVPARTTLYKPCVFATGVGRSGRRKFAMSLQVLFSISLAVYLLWSRLGHRHTRYPPGPSRLPLLGSVHHLSQEYQHKKFFELAKTYGMCRSSSSSAYWYFLPILGDVMYLQLFSWPAVVLGSVQAAQDLLEKRSNIYSDRPRFTLVAKYVSNRSTQASCTANTNTGWASTWP